MDRGASEILAEPAGDVNWQAYNVNHFLLECIMY